MDRNTKQKQIILDMVKNYSDHPTAETVYLRAKQLIPKLSLGTVYRNLAKLAEDGTILRLEGDVDRFDGTTALHTHFVCNGCGEVFDIWEENSSLFAKLKKDGFLLQSENMIVKGLCPQCQINK